MTADMTAKLRLRRFLYLDDRLTGQFLAQAGDEVFEEEELTEETESSRGGGLGLRAGPAQGGAGASKASKTTSSRTVRQTPDGAFTRLAQVLEDGDAVLSIESANQDVWDGLRRGDVLEAECNISVPLLIRIGLFASSAPMAEIAQAFGQQVPDEAARVIQQLGTMISMLKVLPVICELVGSPKYRFVAPVNPECLRVNNLDDLSGEATVFATVEQKIRGRAKWSLLDALGLASLPREARREFDRSVATVDLFKDFTVTAPAAVLSTVAIFR